MEIVLSLAGTRVFIVEDEALILFTLEDLLEDLGCKVAGTAQRIPEALAKAGTVAFDVAILDVNVAGERVDPVADLVAGRGLPFIFATGYGQESLPESHRDRIFMPKPYRKADLRAALSAALPG
ncbi:response regulator [soil metagenome]